MPGTPPVPPPLPSRRSQAPAARPPEAPERARLLARLSWTMPFGVIVAGTLLRRSSASQAALFGQAFGSFLLYALGIGAALVALSRVSRVGRPGVFTPAIVGLSINGLFALIMTVVFVQGVVTASRRSAPRAATLTAASHSAFEGRVTADLPCVPTDVPAEAGAHVRRAHCTAGGMDVNLLYVDSAGRGYDLARGASGLIEKTHEFAQSQGARNWSENRVSESRQRLPATRIAESFDLDGASYSIDALLVSDGQDAWGIQLTRTAGDETVERLVTAALVSFSFRPD